VQRKGELFFEMRRPDKATRNSGDSVAKYQERTAAVCVTLNKAFN
jgi:hypothetical protein